MFTPWVRCHRSGFIRPIPQADRVPQDPAEVLEVGWGWMLVLVEMGMDQYLFLYIINTIFLGGWTSILPAILMWTEGVQGFDTLPNMLKKELTVTACESQPSSGPLNGMMLKIRFSYNLTLWNEFALRLDRIRSQLWFAVLRFMLVSTIQLHLNELGAFRKLELFDSSHGRLVPLVIGPHGLQSEQPAGISEAQSRELELACFLQKQVDDIHWCLS